MITNLSSCFGVFFSFTLILSHLGVKRPSCRQRNQTSKWECQTWKRTGKDEADFARHSVSTRRIVQHSKTVGNISHRKGVWAGRVERLLRVQKVGASTSEGRFWDSIWEEAKNFRSCLRSRNKTSERSSQLFARKQTTQGISIYLFKIFT